MKQTIYFLLLFCNSYLIAQSCLSEGIAFNSQQDIDDFSNNYPDCTEILGNVCIGDCSPPFDNSNIGNLDGLAQLTNIGGYLWINVNSSLVSLNGLNQLTSIGGDLSVRQNGFLTDLSGIDNITSIGGGLDITANASLESISALDQVNTIGSSIEIAGNVALNSLAGLDQITTINGYLRIINNPSLATLEALSNVMAIENFVHLFSNTSLTDLNGLNQLTQIGDLLNISHNTSLINLDGLENLNSIGGLLNIETNSALLNLAALQNLTSINGSLSIKGNTLLNSLNGLENIAPATIINLFIENSNNLSECEVSSICAYLETPNGFEATIIGNATGCNSVSEVEIACGFVGTEELISNNIKVFPNPTRAKIVIFTDTPSTIFLYNSIGQVVKQISTKAGDNEIDLSQLSTGIYILISSNGDVKRIVKQ